MKQSIENRFLFNWFSINIIFNKLSFENNLLLNFDDSDYENKLSSLAILYFEDINDSSSSFQWERWYVHGLDHTDTRAHTYIET